MRSRSFVVTVIAIFALLTGAGAVLAYDHAQRDVIANGIKVGGVDVGGMSAAKARERLRALYDARLSRPLVLRYHARRFTLSASAAHLTIDVPGSVQQAIDRTRSANLFTRVIRSLTGGKINDDLAPRISYSRAAVDQFVRTVSHALDRPARDASVSYSGSGISPVSSETGINVRSAALSSTIAQTLSNGVVRRHFRVPVVKLAPHVTTSQLSTRYPTIITIDRSAFTLHLFRHLRLFKTYTIAVGQAGLETPAGLHYVIDREVDPSWHVPNSAWAGSLAGQIIPPGPQDPLKARWIGFYDGDGIHGTDAISSLGSAASHGCIRMSISDVTEVYGLTPMGSPVFVA